MSIAETKDTRNIRLTLLNHTVTSVNRLCIWEVAHVIWFWMSINPIGVEFTIINISYNLPAIYCWMTENTMDSKQSITLTKLYSQRLWLDHNI